jgi:hypothetical protein
MHVNIQSISLNGEAGLFKGQVIVIAKQHYFENDRITLKKLTELIR